MMSKQEIVEIKEGLEVYAERIETLNPENIWKWKGSMKS